MEDWHAIYQLVASYGPAVDGLSREGLEALWSADGTYETEHHVFESAVEVGAIVDDPMHLGFVEPGCAHVMSLPLITLAGDVAVATNYSRVYVCTGDGWRVARVASNRWELSREDGGCWKVVRRINRLMNGSEASRSLLLSGVIGQP
nr:nuclear transport factor 2 family protein [Novosphingobium taihuense]